jgi:uncharacterized protein YndB with AHSA1/START domain
MHVENSIMINRPIEEVFEYVSTPENDPTWVPVSLRHQRTLPGPMRVGMTTQEDLKFLGTDVEGHLLGGNRVRATDRRSLSSDLRSSLWCC